MDKFNDYHIKKSEDKVLCLIHGIFASHTDFDDMIEAFNDTHFSLYGVKLPPYTDRAKDYNKLGRNEWNQKVYDVLDTLLTKYKEVYVIAHSLGSLLTMQYPRINELQKVVFWAPALVPKVSLTSTKVGLGLGNTPYLQKCKELSSVHASGLLNKWYLIKPTLSLFRQSRHAKKAIPSISIPILIVLSSKDESVHMKSATIIMKSAPSEEKHFIKLQHSYHNVISEEEKFVFHDILDFIQK